MNHDETVELRLAQLLDDRPKSVSDLAIEVRRKIANLAKSSSELLYATYAVSDVFTYSGKLGQAFIHIATYSNHVNLGFNYGARLPDPDELLQGTGNLIRHIRVDSIGVLSQRNVGALIKAAIDLGKKMAEEKTGVQSQQFIDKS